MDSDRALIADFTLKRIQRAVEYALLAAMHVFFLIAFRNFYSLWMAVGVGLVMFCMNFQLTQLRERRRTAGVHSRRRILADTFESIMFLVLIALLSFGGLIGKWLDMADQEYLAYIAAILGGIFLAGFAGELYWQIRHFRRLDPDSMRNYIMNLKRTIILPYVSSRAR
jgi:hypothetical protein